MHCNNCGATSVGKYDFCPNCGAYVKNQRLVLKAAANAEPPPAEPVAEVRAEPEAASPQEPMVPSTTPAPRSFARPLKRKPGMPRYAGAIVLMGVWLLAVLIGFGAAGAIQGLQNREQNAVASSAEHKAKAKSYLEQGNLELAVVELTEARRLNPNDPEIASLIAEVETPPAPPTPSPAPSPALSTAVPAETLNSTLAEARTAYAAKDYETAVVKLESLRRSDPNFHKSDVDDMLYNSYLTLARQYLKDQRFEEGVQRFDKALAIRPSDSVLSERNLAANYFRGLSARGADWSRAIDAFTAVVQGDPKYYDAYSLLYEARVQYGDVLVQRNDPCRAAEQYAAAIVMGVTADLQSKQAAASAACTAIASGTPVGGTPSATRPGGSSPGGAKFTVTVQPGYQATGDPDASIRGVVKDRSGRGVAGLELTLFSTTTFKTVATTGTDGAYNFDGLPPGGYGVRVSDDPASTSPIVTVSAKQRAIINFSGN